MPKAFTECVKRGGKVRTITQGPAKGRLICWLPGRSPKGILGEKRTDLKRKA